MRYGRQVCEWLSDISIRVVRDLEHGDFSGATRDLEKRLLGAGGTHQKGKRALFHVKRALKVYGILNPKPYST